MPCLPIFPLKILLAKSIIYYNYTDWKEVKNTEILGIGILEQLIGSGLDCHTPHGNKEFPIGVFISMATRLQ